MRLPCAAPWEVTLPRVVALTCSGPSELTLAVETGAGHIIPPAIVGPLSVESVSEPPEPAVDGAAMGSAMAPSAREGIRSTVLYVVFGFCFVGFLKETS